MNLDLSATDVRMASRLIFLLRCLNERNDPDVLRDALANFANGPIIAQTFPATDLLPEVLAVYADGLTLILILGALRLSQIQALAIGYTQRRDARLPNGYNPASYAAAFAVNSALINQNIPINNRVIIAGHSFGGTVALALVSIMQSVYMQRNYSVCTFGSPKAGDDRVEIDLRGIDIGRWMNTGDNVVWAPPLHGRAPIMYALLPVAAGNNMEEYQQTFPGAVIDADSVITRSYLPPVPGVFTDMSILNFLINNEAPVAIEHRISTYDFRLRAAANLIPDIAPQIAAVNNANDQVAQPHRRNPEVIADAALNPLAGAPAFVGPTIAQGIDRPYYTQKVNGQNCVMWLGVIMAVCKGPKSSRKLASAMNTAWNRWNASKAADGSSFQFSVGENFQS